jgi:hypothetical protein
MPEPTAFIYESLHHLNQAVEQAIQHVKRLQEFGAMDAEYAEIQIVTMLEAKTAINHKAVGTVYSKEERNWAEYGQLKAQIEPESAQKPLEFDIRDETNRE